MKVPNSATNLGKAIRRLCKEGEDDIRLARAMAEVLVGQMLPDGVVKGGSSISREGRPDTPRDRGFAPSEEGSDRAHDLIDLQLVSAHSALNLKDIKVTCERLFKYRRKQAWPPRIIKGEKWDEVYAGARETLRDGSSVLPSVDEAIIWANELIVRIATAK